MVALLEAWWSVGSSLLCRSHHNSWRETPSVRGDHGTTHKVEMSDKLTYKMPSDGWVCFHCGHRFLTPNAARDHFGFYPTADPTCTITRNEFKDDLRLYRVLERRFGTLSDSVRNLYQKELERVMMKGDQ